MRSRDMTIQEIKETYVLGQRIRLLHMEDQYQPIPDGAEGSIEFIDDAGQIHMKWDNGRSLALIPGIDQFELI